MSSKKWVAIPEPALATPQFLTPPAARFTLLAMTRHTRMSVILAAAVLIFAAGCGSSNRNTSKFMKSVNSIKPGHTMDSVRKAIGRPDTKKTGETPVRPYPPIGSPEGVLGTLPPETKYEQWIYKRGDSRYHVFFAKRTIDPQKWEVIAVRSAPSDVVQ